MIALLLALTSWPTGSYVEGSATAARDYWGATACLPIRVQYRPPRPDGVTAWTAPDFCLIRLHAWAPGAEPLGLCYVMTHEYGHLLGYMHDATEPVMRIGESRHVLPAPCWRMTQRRRHRRWHARHPRPQTSVLRRRAHKRFHRRLRRFPSPAYTELRERAIR